VLLLTLPTGPLPAQRIVARGGRVDLSGSATVVSLGYAPLTWGPVSLFGAGLVVAGKGAELYGVTSGAEFQVDGHWRLTGEVGAAIGTGVWSGDAMTWSAGLGYDLLRRPLNVGVEARYRRLVDLDARGIELGVRLAIPLRRGSRSRSVPLDQPVTPAETPAPVISSDSVADSRVLTLVSIARGAMGTPYLWGGSDANGFDCSGLVQYAYARIGIALPRTSVGQARAGRPVDRDPEALEPGDVLTFGSDGSTVTHVGFYVGDGWFIHSTRQGVRQSRLRPEDPDARWWLGRWIGARRMME
jgi:hypothetical protein